MSRCSTGVIKNALTASRSGLAMAGNFHLKDVDQLLATGQRAISLMIKSI
jgi:hypothetical protein